MSEVVEAADYQVRLMDAQSLVPYARNSRTHSPDQVRQIKSSILEWGWTNPILADLASGNVIVAGHGRQMAALELFKDGAQIKLPGGRLLPAGKIPVIDCSGWSEAQRRAYVIADNKLALNAGWDNEMLAVELEELRDLDFDLLLTGFGASELADLLDPSTLEPKCDPDEIPTPEVEVFSKKGDLWICGDHRVLCGDSTSFEDVERLLGGKDVLADCVWTDPPYLMAFEGAINHEGKKSKSGAAHKAIANDKMSKEDGERFLRDVTSMIKAKCRGAFYVSFYRLGIEWMMRAMTDVGLKWRNLIIWRKNNHNLSNSDYKSIYEPILFGWSDDYHAVLYGWTEEHMFRGPKGERDVLEVGIPSVWDIEKTKKNALHPTVMPVALVERSIKNSSLPGQTVLDLFGGSGTTLIGAQMTGRHARLMELEPAYVDVICRRFHMFTGLVPVHAETGEPFPIEKFGQLPEQK